MIRALLGTARATFWEVAQEPSALLLSLAAVTLTTLIPIFQFHQMGEAGRLARDSGLACLLMFGLPLAIMGASATVHRELTDGTASVALVKPLPRGLFLVGPFVGIAGVCTVFWWSVTVAMLLAERASERMIDTGMEILDVKDARLSAFALLTPCAVLGVAALLNCLKRVRFGVAAFFGLPIGLTLVLAACGFWEMNGAWHWAWSAHVAWRCVPVASLLLFALWMYGAFAAAMAARFGGVGTMGLSFGLFALGLCADAVTQGGGGAWRTVFGALVPNAQHFWMADILGRGGHLPPGYVLAGGLWALGWCVVFLMAGTMLLNRRDVG